MRSPRWSFSASVVLAALLIAAATLFNTLRLVPPVQAQMGTGHYPTYDNDAAIDRALAYLATQQDASGGIISAGTYNPDNSPDPGTTCRVVLAVVAAGRPADSLQAGGNTMIDYLSAQASDYIYDDQGRVFPSRAGILLAAVVAAGEDPTSFAGINLVETMQSTYHASGDNAGTYSTDAAEGFTSGAPGVVNQFWAIFGLSAAGEPIPPAATDYYLTSQAADGGWGFSSSSDLDSTAYVVVGLLASGNVSPEDAAIQDALAFFRTQQLPGGGWKSAWDTTTNANTTGWVINALVAAGFTPPTKSWSHLQGDPREALLALQQSSGENEGAIGGDYTNALSTVDSLFGLIDQPLTFLSSSKRANATLGWLNEQQNSDGSWSSWGSPSAGATIDALLAYTAAGYDPATVKAGGSNVSPVDYLETQASTYSSGSAASAGKLALAVASVGQDPRSFNGVDLVDVLSDTLAYDNSSDLWYYGTITNTYDQSYAILGLLAAGEVPSATMVVTTLVDLQDDTSGGWKYDDGMWSAVSPDDTGLALQALAAVRSRITDTVTINTIDTSMAAGVGYLAENQQTNGGWSSWGTPNSDSTAYAIQGLLAAGEDPSASPWVQQGHTPYDALRSFQKPDGPFVYAWDYPTDNLMSSSKAVPALLGVHLAMTPTEVMTPGALIDFVAPTSRGADPDRMLVAHPRASWGSSGLDLVLPFGSDMNGDGAVTEIAWRPIIGATGWTTSTTFTRLTGYYTATATDGITSSMSYEVRATFQDPDGVQDRTRVTNEPVSLSGFVGVAEAFVNPALTSSPVVTLTYSPASGGGLEAAFPTSAVTEPTTFLYTPAAPPAATSVGYLPTAWAFSLHAVEDETSLVPTFDLVQPVTLTIHYRDDQVGAAAEGSLRLFTRDGDEWKDSTNGCGAGSSYQHDPSNHLVSITICSTGEFALFNQGTEQTVGPGSADVSVLRYDRGDGYVEVTIPPASVTETTTFRLTPVMTPTLAGRPLYTGFAGWSFTLSGTQGGAALASDFAFAAPISITVKYRSGDVRVVKEGSLNLYHTTQEQWNPAATTCTPTASSALNIGDKRLTTQGCSIGTFTLLNRGVEVSVDPSSSGVTQLTYTADNGGSIAIIFPNNAVDAATDMVYTPMLTPTQELDSHAFAGWAFALNAFRGDSPVEELAFTQPVTVTIYYMDEDVAESGEDQMKLYYLDEQSAWADVATTCNPASTYTRDTATNRLSVNICHLSDYGAFNQQQQNIYLPLIVR